MALFNKEPEKNPKIQSATTPSPSPISSAPAPSTSSSPAATAPRANGPAPAEARAYLDRGSKISGKISFEGPARIDGEVDGEIVAKDSITIGESAVVTAHIRAASVSVAGKVSGDIVASQRIDIRPVGEGQRKYHGACSVGAGRRAVRGTLLDAARGRPRRPQSYRIPQGGARGTGRARGAGRRRAEAGLIDGRSARA